MELPFYAWSIEKTVGMKETAASRFRCPGWLQRLSSWTRRSSRFTLHGMLDVPGVALSGGIGPSADSTGSPAIDGDLVVRGRLPGELTLRGLTLSGRVGRVRVRAHLATP
jgi:hypothetical protein